ncbi:hypothetical protein DB345_03930 [Spartobacteria bacterium LR76]|nr:hypothetical protein DB345_03930 [Spartobacteria bacterium LR76]
MLTVGHEIYHHIEISAPALARDIRAQLEPLLRDGAQIEREKGGHDPERRYHEIAGDIFGDALADPSFWDRLNAANPTTFRKVAFVVKDWLSKAIRFLRANGYQSNRYLTDIERAHEVVAAALGKFAEKPFADSSLNLEPYDPNQNFYEGDSKEKAPEFDSGSKRSPEQLKKLRANYVGEASALRETKEKMLEAGDSLEKVARTLHRMRNDLKLKYRDLTPEGEVLRFEERVVSP